MFAQPVRWGGLALAYALATATLVLVTVVASNLVLSAVAELGSLTSAEPAADSGAVEAVLLSAGQRAAQRTDRRSAGAECERHRNRGAGRGEQQQPDEPCGERRAGAADRRP